MLQDFQEGAMMNETIKNLYFNKLQYNCSYKLMKRKDRSDLMLVYLGCNDFVVISNYNGVVALGSRKYDFDKKELSIYYEVIKGNVVNHSACERLLASYEHEIMKLNCNINFERVEE